MKKGITNLIIASFAVALGISLSMKPWRVFAQQKHSTDQQIAELHRVENEQVQDLQNEAKYGTNVGREELARSQGWHKKGEVPADN